MRHKFRHSRSCLWVEFSFTFCVYLLKSSTLTALCYARGLLETLTTQIISALTLALLLILVPTLICCLCCKTHATIYIRVWAKLRDEHEKRKNSLDERELNEKKKFHYYFSRLLTVTLTHINYIHSQMFNAQIVIFSLLLLSSPYFAHLTIGEIFNSQLCTDSVYGRVCECERMRGKLIKHIRGKSYAK